MRYPMLQEVQKADRIAICRMWRFLPSPVNIEQTSCMDMIAKRFKELGGFTPEISKAVGWKE